jgi:hypothetical protein
MKLVRFIAPLLAALVLCAFAAQADQISAGAAIVQANGCMGCHGAAFHGGIGPALYGIEHRRSAAQIATAIAKPKAPMPTFPFSTTQISALVAYLSSLDGGASLPVATLAPANPGSHAVLSVRFPGRPPSSVIAVPAMQMGDGRMEGAPVDLHATKDPHLWQGTVSFSMAGPWSIDIRYDAKRLTLPVNVSGSM